MADRLPGLYDNLPGVSCAAAGLASSGIPAWFCRDQFCPGRSAQSLYSHFGANRELMQILYEPILLLFALAVYAQNGSFMISSILENSTPLLASLACLYRCGDSLDHQDAEITFDIATSHHGHQELVKGIMTEISGPYYAIVTLTEWYELVLAWSYRSVLEQLLWVGILVPWQHLFWNCSSTTLTLV